MPLIQISSSVLQLIFFYCRLFFSISQTRSAVARVWLPRQRPTSQNDTKLPRLLPFRRSPAAAAAAARCPRYSLTDADNWKPPLLFSPLDAASRPDRRHGAAAADLRGVRDGAAADGLAVARLLRAGLHLLARPPQDAQAREDRRADGGYGADARRVRRRLHCPGRRRLHHAAERDGGQRRGFPLAVSVRQYPGQRAAAAAKAGERREGRR